MIKTLIMLLLLILTSVLCVYDIMCMYVCVVSECVYTHYDWKLACTHTHTCSYTHTHTNTHTHTPTHTHTYTHIPVPARTSVSLARTWNSHQRWRMFRRLPSNMVVNPAGVCLCTCACVFVYACVCVHVCVCVCVCVFWVYFRTNVSTWVMHKRHSLSLRTCTISHEYFCTTVCIKYICVFLYKGDKLAYWGIIFSFHYWPRAWNSYSWMCVCICVCVCVCVYMCMCVCMYVLYKTDVYSRT